MKAIMASTGGRAPPGQNRPTPCAGSRWPGAVRGSPARAADLLGNRADGLILRGVLALVVENHPNRTLADLRRIGGYSLRHGSILSRVGASDKPGAVHRPLGSPACA